MTQIYIKQNIHKHRTQNFRRISPFGITPVEKAHKARTRNWKPVHKHIIQTLTNYTKHKTLYWHKHGETVQRCKDIEEQAYTEKLYTNTTHCTNIDKLYKPLYWHKHGETVQRCKDIGEQTYTENLYTNTTPYTNKHWETVKVTQILRNCTYTDL